MPPRALLSALSLSLLFCAANAAGHTPFYVASNWQRYPGYTGSVDATQFTGYVKVEEGSSADEIHLSGEMSGLPAGTFGIHIHSGFDVTNKDTIGGHFYPGLETDPWNDVMYTGPTWTIEPKIAVAGIDFESTLGRVMVIHDATDRVGIAKLLPFPEDDHDHDHDGDHDHDEELKFSSAHLESFAHYNSLTTTLGPYPESTAKGQGSVTSDSRVWVSAKADGTYVVHYHLKGLPAEETSGGIHVHTGTSCATHEEVLGHYYTTAEDPWTTVWTKAAGETAASGMVEVVNPGFELGMNEHHAFVVHEADGDRIACGILHSVARASIGAVEGSSVSGTVWVAEVDSSTGMLRVSYELSGLPAGALQGGLHIHAGSSCAEPGPHFWPENEDPWTVTMWKRNSSAVAVASGFFDIDSGYALAENADHVVMVHGADGFIGCGVLVFTPAVTGFVAASKDDTTLTLSGNVGGLSMLPCASVGSACTVSVGAAGSCSLLGGDATATATLADSALLALRTPAGGLTATGDAGLSGGYYMEAEVTVAASMEVEGSVVLVRGSKGELVACGAVAESALEGLTDAEIEALSAGEVDVDGGEDDDEDGAESGAMRVGAYASGALVAALSALLLARC